MSPRRSPRFRSIVALFPLGLSLSVIVYTVRSTSCEVSGGCVGAWLDFDDNLIHFPEFLLVLRCASATAPDVVVSLHSAISAASRRIWTRCESSPASFPTRSTSAFAGDVVVLASHAFFLRQIVLSRFAMYFGLGPIKMGSRSLRTFSGIPRVTGVGFHGSQTMAFKRAVSQRRLSTLRFDARLRTMLFVWFSDQMLIVFAFTSRATCFRKMLIPTGSPVLLWSFRS